MVKKNEHLIRKGKTLPGFNRQRTSLIHIYWDYPPLRLKFRFFLINPSWGWKTSSELHTSRRDKVQVIMYPFGYKIFKSSFWQYIFFPQTIGNNWQKCNLFILLCKACSSADTNKPGDFLCVEESSLGVDGWEKQDCLHLWRSQ